MGNDRQWVGTMSRKLLLTYDRPLSYFRVMEEGLFSLKYFKYVG